MKYKNIAKSCIKGSKIQSRAIYMGLAAMCTFHILILIFQASILGYRQESNFKTYGAWSGAIYHGNYDIYSFLDHSKDVQTIGTISVFTDISVFDERLTSKVGKIDSDAIKLSRMKILEGRFPENEKEITIEKHILNQINPNAHIGGEITIPIQRGDSQLQEEYKFTLSGIIDSWNTNWDTAATELPSIFVWDEDVFWENSKVDEHFLLLGKENADYVIHDIDKYLKTYPESVYVYNAKAYAPILSAEDKYFKQGTFLAMLGAMDALIICFLLSFSVPRLKYRIAVVRSAGGDLCMVYQLSMWEACLLWGKGMLIGLVTGSAVCGLICLTNILFPKLDIPVVFRPTYLLVSLLLLSLIFFAGYFLITVSALGIKMNSGFREDNRNVSGKLLLPVKRIKPMNIFRLYKRYVLFYPLRSILRVGISVLAILILDIYIVKFGEHFLKYQQVEVKYDYTLETYDLKTVLNMDQINRIKEIPGIIDVQCGKKILTSDGPLTVLWEGWKDSEYINTLRKNSYISSDENRRKEQSDSFELGNITGIQDFQLIDWYIECTDEGEPDSDKLKNGEQCILLFSPYTLAVSQMQDWQYEVSTIVNEDDYNKVSKIYTYGQCSGDIRPGDFITVKAGEIEKQIEVGGIINSVTGWPPDLMGGVVGSGEVIVSDKFVEKFMGIKEDDYNSFVIKSSANADHAETDWQLTNVIDQYMYEQNNDSYYFHNSREGARVVREMELTGMIQATFIMVFVVLLLAFILFQGTIEKVQNESKRIRILHNCGMTKRKIKVIYWMEILTEGVLSAAIGMTGAGIIQYMSWKKDSGYTKVQAVLDYAMNANIINRHVLEIYAVIFVFYFITYTLLVIYPVKKLLKEECGGKRKIKK